MKILITEQRPGAATEVAQRLGAAGHMLTYCHSPDPDDAPCVALGATGRCPLADPDVAVVVDARLDRAVITGAEFGAVCALKHGTPLVVAGPVPDENASPWRDADVRCEPKDVVAACDQAASPIGAAAHRAATAAATRVLGQVGNGEDVRVALRERKGVVDAYVTTGRALPSNARMTTRHAVRAALAPYTRFWLYGDVIFRFQGRKKEGTAMASTKRWSVRVFIDEHDGTTRAEARLDTADKTHLVGIGTARLNPHDLNVPEIGDELATARALSELAHRLLDAAVEDIESVTHRPVHLDR